MLENILDIEGDTEKVRGTLVRIKTVLNVTAYESAQRYLYYAEEAFSSASQRDPWVKVWSLIGEAQNAYKRANDALNACLESTELLLNIEETGEDEIDGINSDIKSKSVEQHVIAALLNGANYKVNLAMAMKPDSSAPGARCNPDKIMVQK